MRVKCCAIFLVLPFFILLLAASDPAGQNGNAGAVSGTVTDPSGAVIPGATVHLTSPISGLDRTAITDTLGQFEFSNIPVHPFRIAVTANGFADLHQSVELRSANGINLKLVLQIATAASTVTVEAGGDLVETDSTFHTDVDRELFTKIPLESESSGISSLVTLSTPGVAADSNGPSTAWAITRRIPFPLMARPLPTSRARFSPTRFRWTRCSRLR